MKVLLTQKMAGISGSERYIMSILPELRRNGIDASFLVVQHPANAKKNNLFVEEMQAAGVPVNTINTYWSISPLLIWKIARFISKHQFDLLQTNLIHADVWGACVKRIFISRLKIISVKHGYSESFQTKHGLNPDNIQNDKMSFLTRWAAKSANRVVNISQALEDFHVKGRLITKEKALTIPYGFDFSNAITIEKHGNLRYGNPQIIVAGRIVPVKQHNMLIEILPELIKEYPKISVVMVGDGPLLEILKKRTDELGLSNHVHWEGFRKNIHDYIRDSDIMVIPSAAEGFGLVVLEAWYHAKPVVAFNVPAINEIITPGEDGILIDPFDTNKLLLSLKELLSSPDKIKKLGETGRKKQDEVYGLHEMTKKTISVFEQICKN